MRKVYLLLMFALLSPFVRGQYVTIPDAQFRAWLQTHGYAGCMSGTMLDTTCSLIVNTTALTINDATVEDITGITYFDNLLYLNCQSVSSFFDTIPKLPATLKSLYCSNISGIHLPTLPLWLDTLGIFQCGNVNFPPLPPLLRVFSCGYSNGASFPVLPAGLVSFNCAGCFSSSIPSLPSSLKYLYCDWNHLDSLPVLPAGLQELGCSGNNFTTLPNLPSGLKGLRCQILNLTSLPALPMGLLELECNNNLLTQLPQLPQSLTWLNCKNNLITQLPALPQNLYWMDCSNNQLTSIPALSADLQYLICERNQIAQLPDFPAALLSVRCSFNPITCLPYFSHQLAYLFADSTNLQCFPPVNIVTASPNLPVCSDTFNPYGCVFANIKGHVYKEGNFNCSHDISDSIQAFVKVNLYSGANGLLQQAYSNDLGEVKFYMPFDSVYTLIVDTFNQPFEIYCPSLSLTPYVEDTAFYFRCKPGFDLEASALTQVNGTLFPSLSSMFNIIAGDIGVSLHPGGQSNPCPSSQSGTVMVVISGPASFAGNVIPLPTSFSADTIVWQVSNFSQFQLPMVTVLTDTLAQIGQDVCFEIYVVANATGDRDTSNNYLHTCYTVTNSLDPNYKEVTPTYNVIPGDWLYYTIHFQNVGNAPAINIKVLDTLDTMLDEATFQLLNSSHTAITSVNYNNVEFAFNNINLPDSASDPVGSMGYVQYRVKVNQNAPAGFVIPNTASIYFDFNTPIVTNTVTSINCIPLFSSFSQTICSNETFNFNGINLTATGTYFDTLQIIQGCDSIITLNLTVLNTSSSSYSQTICSNETFNFNDTQLTATGTYYDTLQNAMGCDSIVTLNLTVLSSLNTSITGHLCFLWSTYQFNGQVLQSPGIYTDTLTSSTGCDSVITLNLLADGVEIDFGDVYLCPDDTFVYWEHVIPSWTQQYDFVYPNNFGGCDTVVRVHAIRVLFPDIYVTNSNGILYATPLNANSGIGYSLIWYDCDNDLKVYDGWPSNSFSPSVSGSYYAMNNTPCGSFTTACFYYNSIGEMYNQLSFTLMPNPANSNVMVSLVDAGDGGTLQLLNSVGQLVLQQTIEQNNTMLDISTLALGIYFVQVNTAKGVGVKKLVVQR